MKKSKLTDGLVAFELPFVGEGCLKVRGRLRFGCLRRSERRVLRLVANAACWRRRGRVRRACHGITTTAPSFRRQAAFCVGILPLHC